MGLVDVSTGRAPGNIRHYNLRRTVTVEADIDRDVTDTVEVNRRILEAWDDIRAEFPGTDLDFTGELDDINESLESMSVLFILGIGLIYLILATQFKSYFQPLLILLTVPMAFTGVVFGLLISRNPLSLYTLYGIIALAGIAVNAAIVLIDAANQRLAAGMRPLHATVFAARRRVVPILMTTATTIAGLMSLAVGLGGRSLLWGPVAVTLVWGLTVSALLTLFVIPGPLPPVHARIPLVIKKNLFCRKAAKQQSKRLFEFFVPGFFAASLLLFQKRFACPGCRVLWVLGRMYR